MSKTKNNDEEKINIEVTSKDENKENAQVETAQNDKEEAEIEKTTKNDDEESNKKAEKIKLKILVAFTDKNNEKVHYKVDDVIEFSIKRAEELLKDTRNLVKKVD